MMNNPTNDAQPTGTRKPLWKRWWVWIVGLIFLAVVGNIGDDPTGSPSQVAAGDTSTTSDAMPTSTTELRPLAATTTTTFAPEPLDYEILETEDVSFPGAVRVSLRVVVEEGATAAELRNLAEQLAEQHRASHEYQAFNIFFYHYPELAFDFATVGIWDDSPYGDWGRADEVSRGDYTHHEANDQIREKNWSLLPSQQEVDLYIAYIQKFDAMDSGSELPSDDEVITEVSADTGASISEVENAIDSVLDWMFDEG